VLLNLILEQGFAQYAKYLKSFQRLISSCTWPKQKMK